MHELPPEVRIKGFDNAGTVRLSFTRPMVFNNATRVVERINQHRPSMKPQTDERLKYTQPLLEVFVLRTDTMIGREIGDSEESSENQDREPLLEDWEVISVTDLEMVVSLKFIRPMEVSQGIEPDRILL